VAQRPATATAPRAVELLCRKRLAANQTEYFVLQDRGLKVTVIANT
jgi:hypothetical protein